MPPQPATCRWLSGTGTAITGPTLRTRARTVSTPTVRSSWQSVRGTVSSSSSSSSLEGWHRPTSVPVDGNTSNSPDASGLRSDDGDPVRYSRTATRTGFGPHRSALPSGMANVYVLPRFTDVTVVASLSPSFRSPPGISHTISSVMSRNRMQTVMPHPPSSTGRPHRVNVFTTNSSWNRFSGIVAISGFLFVRFGLGWTTTSNPVSISAVDYF